MNKSMKKKLKLAAAIAIAMCMVPGYMNAQTREDDVIFECKVFALKDGIKYYLRESGIYLTFETSINSATEFMFVRDPSWTYGSSTLGTSYYMIGGGHCMGRHNDADVIGGALVYSDTVCYQSSTYRSRITQVKAFPTTASPKGFVLYTKANPNLFFTGRQWADGALVEYKARANSTNHYISAIFNTTECRTINNWSYGPKG